MTALRDGVAAYLRAYPGEAADVAALEGFLERTATPDIYRRDNFDGHVTASAFVVDATPDTVRRVLMVHHTALGRWLQPGGHVEAGDGSVLAAALREVGEEVGIPAKELRLLGTDAAWLDVDAHAIPANPRKAEPAHVHHDLRWAFAYEGDPRALHTEAGAIGGYRWLSFAEAYHLPGFGKVVDKLTSLSW